MKTSSLSFILILCCVFCLMVRCKDDDVDRKDAKPVAQFTAQNDGCKFPCTITFTNTSQNANSWKWDFGDGAGSTEESPSHEYIESGEYTVTLTSIGPGGEDSFSLPILITSDPVAIKGVYPNSNPVGGPVLIEGEGFTEDTEIYFNNEKAVIEERSSTFLTTKVPNGLGASTATLRVESGVMFDEEPFDVLSAFPSDLPGSPPSIVIPQGGVTAPFFYTITTIDIITVMNVYDTTHIIELVFGINSEDPDDLAYSSNEAIILDGIKYSSPINFDGSPLYDFSDRENPVVPMMEINRSSSIPSNHPHQDDELSGKFFTMEEFEFPEATLQFKRAGLTDNFLLLTSHVTGRQFLFVVVCTNFFEGECFEF